MNANLFAFEGLDARFALAENFHHREHVGVALAGVEQVGKRVDDGQARIFGELFDNLLLECPDYKSVQESPHDVGGVLDSLAARELEVVCVHHHGGGRQARRRQPRTKGACACSFEENQPPALPFENVETPRRAEFLVAVGEGENFGRLRGCEVGVFKK